MKPVSFHKFKVSYTHPDPDIEPLPVLRVTYGNGYRGLVSCWKPSFRDILRILLGKPVYLTIFGYAQPPVSLCTSRDETIGTEEEQQPAYDSDWDPHGGPEVDVDA